MARIMCSVVLLVGIALPAIAGNLKNGENLFKKHCKSCHRLTEGVLMGPSLKGVTMRLSDEWLDKWIKDPKGVFDSGDPYAVEILEKFKKMMPKKSAMSKKENREDVILFLKENDKK